MGRREGGRAPTMFTRNENLGRELSEGKEGNSATLHAAGRERAD